MNKFKTTLVLLLTLCLLLSACAPASPAASAPQETSGGDGAEQQTAAPEQPAQEQNEPEQSAEPQTPEEVLDQMEAAFDARAEEYAPEIRTLASGVQVQRTPAGEDNRFRRMGISNVSTNNYYLNADKRGCGACHTDLAVLADNLKDYPHCQMENALGIEITVQMCIDCHNCTGTIESQNTFGGIIHGLHDKRNAAFAAMDGDCWSCHYATDYDDMKLWDEVKHDVLRGITHLNSSVISGEFTWEQDTVVGNDDAMWYAWMDGEDAYNRYTKDKLGLEPDPETDGIYDTWEILVAGEVENPMTMTISEMLESFPVVTKTITTHCMVNPMGGPLISNLEVTGVQLRDILDRVGLTKNAKSVRVGGEGTFAMGGQPPYGTHGPSLLPLEWIYDYDMLVATEIDGEPIDYRLGYPLMLCVGFGGAYLNYMEMHEIVAIADETTWSQNYWGGKDDDGVSYVDMPNVGICYFNEGQIIEAVEPYTFEGYAHALGKKITAVEFSFDQGKTWTSYPVENADVSRWVYWHFTWTPPQEGSYVIMIRSVDEDGHQSPEPIEKLINARV